MNQNKSHQNEKAQVIWRRIEKPKIVWKRWVWLTLSTLPFVSILANTDWTSASGSPGSSNNSPAPSEATVPSAVAVSNLDVGLARGRPYSPRVSAIPGDAVSFKVFLENTGGITGKSGIIQVNLDPRLTYIPHSCTLLRKINNENKWTKLKDDTIQIEGPSMTWRIGDMLSTPSSAIYLTFQTRVNIAQQFSYGRTNLTVDSEAQFENSESASAQAFVEVIRDQKFQPRVVVTQELSKGSNSLDDLRTKLIVKPNERFNLNISLVNESLKPLKDLKIVPRLPSGFLPTGEVRLFGFGPTTLKIAKIDSSGHNGLVLGELKPGTLNAGTVQFPVRISEEAARQYDGSRNLAASTRIVYRGKFLGESGATITLVRSSGIGLSFQVLDPYDQKWKAEVGPVPAGQLLQCRVLVQTTDKAKARNPVLRLEMPDSLSYLSQTATQDSEYLAPGPQKSLTTTGIRITNLEPTLPQEIAFSIRVNKPSAQSDSMQSITAHLETGDLGSTSDVVKVLLKGRGP